MEAVHLSLSLRFFRLKPVVPFAVSGFRQTMNNGGHPPFSLSSSFLDFSLLCLFCVCDLRQTVEQWRPPTSRSLFHFCVDLNLLCLLLCVTSGRQTDSGTMEAAHLPSSSFLDLSLLCFFLCVTLDRQTDTQRNNGGHPPLSLSLHF